MLTLNTAKIIRRLRHRLELSQEGLSRLLNATKGAIQHWERGRNNPDLSRLLALRDICPPGSERRELDALIGQIQSKVAPVPVGREGLIAAKGEAGRRAARHLPPSPTEGFAMLRRENERLRRQSEKLRKTLERQKEQLRILSNLATNFQRELAELRSAQSSKGPPTKGAPSLA